MGFTAGAQKQPGAGRASCGQGRGDTLHTRGTSPPARAFWHENPLRQVPLTLRDLRVAAETSVYIGVDVKRVWPAPTPGTAPPPGSLFFLQLGADRRAWAAAATGHIVLRWPEGPKSQPGTGAGDQPLRVEGPGTKRSVFQSM